MRDATRPHPHPHPDRKPSPVPSTQARRFEMQWMFVGKQEKAAAQTILSAAVGCDGIDALELSKAAKRYGVTLA